VGKCSISISSSFSVVRDVDREESFEVRELRWVVENDFKL
jgi:hypothetical protein